MSGDSASRSSVLNDDSAATTTTTPFLRPVQRICLDANGHAGLRERMYQVVAGAVLVYPGCKAFKLLWRAVKSLDDPAPASLSPCTPAVWRS